jgi:helicase
VQTSSFNPAQREVVQRGLLSCGFHCVLQMPTGTGKTWLAERAIDEVLARGHRAVYLTPLRAQADELLQRWRSRFGTYPVGAYAGTSAGSAPDVPYSKACVLIMTPERLDACTRWWRTHWDWLPEVELLIVDEFHLLADPSRGPRLEGALGRFRRLNPLARILALSATLGNREELADWLEGVEYASDWRAIPLSWRIARYKKAQEKPEAALTAVRACVAGGGRSLVFVQSRRRAEQLAGVLREGGLRAAHHHAGLDSTARRKVEGEFKAGSLNAMVATGTLEMGVNLPVRQVVLYDLQSFDGADYQPLPVWSAWQRGGRAGRPGLDDRGEVVLLAPSWSREAERYLTPNFEAVRSGLSASAALAEQVVTEVATGLCRTVPQLERALGASLAGFQGRLPSIAKSVGTMLDAGMLATKRDDEEAAPRLVATKLGRIAVRQMLVPETVLTLARGLTGAESDRWTFLDLLLLACATTDAEPVLAVDFEELEDLSSLLGAERSWLLGDLERARAALGRSGRALLSVVKMAVCARRWTRLGDATEVAEATSAYPFEIVRLSESLERILAAAQAIVAPAADEEPPAPALEEPNLRERLGALVTMVSAGVNEETVTLTLLDGVGPALARRLSAAGIRDIEDMAGADQEQIAAIRGISAKRAGKLISDASTMVPHRSAWCFRETGPQLRPIAGAWPPQIDPYRLRRAIDLRVARRAEGWTVTGGSDPHRVHLAAGEPKCDCPDFAKGILCKHVLAVQLATHDPTVTRVAEELRGGPASGVLDLQSLWFDQLARASA